MHTNYFRGETREFVSRRRHTGNGWGYLTFFNKHSAYNRKHRAQVNQALREAARDDAWDNFVCPILDEAEDPWYWD